MPQIPDGCGTSVPHFKSVQCEHCREKIMKRCHSNFWLMAGIGYPSVFFAHRPSQLGPAGLTAGEPRWLVLQPLHLHANTTLHGTNLGHAASLDEVKVSREYKNTLPAQPRATMLTWFLRQPVLRHFPALLTLSTSQPFVSNALRLVKCFIRRVPVRRSIIDVNKRAFFPV